jgi:hypothetical protein
MHKISCFSEIPITSDTKTLFVFDIDDTLIHFKELGKTWWNHMYSAYLIEYKGDKVQAKWATLKIWMDKIYMYNPHPIAPESFSHFLQRVEQEDHDFILLTARDPSLRSITEKHLSDCGITIASDKIYFNEEKGKALREIVDFRRYSKVVFVDDVEKNLEDVASELAGVCEVHLYQFEAF